MPRSEGSFWWDLIPFGSALKKMNGKLIGSEGKSFKFGLLGGMIHDIDTLLGSVLQRCGLFSTMESDGSRLKKLQAEQLKVEKQLQDLDEKYLTFLSDMKTLEKTNQDLRMSLSAAKDSTNFLQNEIDGLQHDLQESERSSTKLRNSIESFDSVKSDFEEKIKSLAYQKQSRDEIITNLRKERDDARRQLNEYLTAEKENVGAVGAENRSPSSSKSTISPKRMLKNMLPKGGRKRQSKRKFSKSRASAPKVGTV